MFNVQHQTEIAFATKCGPFNGASHKMIAVWPQPTGSVQVQHFSPLATVAALASWRTKWKTISASRQAWRRSTFDNLSLPASANIEKPPSTMAEGLQPPTAESCRSLRWYGASFL